MIHLLPIAIIHSIRSCKIVGEPEFVLEKNNSKVQIFKNHLTSRVVK